MPSKTTLVLAAMLAPLALSTGLYAQEWEEGSYEYDAGGSDSGSYEDDSYESLMQASQEAYDSSPTSEELVAQAYADAGSEPGYDSRSEGWWTGTEADANYDEALASQGAANAVQEDYAKASADEDLRHNITMNLLRGKDQYWVDQYGNQVTGTGPSSSGRF